MWREGRNSQRSAVLNAAARGWHNRNKRLTGSRGHVLKLWLGEWWWEEHETEAAFFFFPLSFCLCLVVWRHTGSAVKHVLEYTVILMNYWTVVSGCHTGSRACCRATREWNGEITCNSRELQVRRKNLDAEDRRWNYKQSHIHIRPPEAITDIDNIMVNYINTEHKYFWSLSCSYLEPRYSICSEYDF